MSQAEMTFWDHLEELRKTLFRAIGILLVAFVVCFVLIPKIFDTFILGPSKPDFFLYEWLCSITGGRVFSGGVSADIIAINVTTQFMTHISVAFALAVIVAFPLLVVELWRFLEPALYKGEKGPVGFVFTFGSVMFYLGCAVGYAVVFPIMYRFLTEYTISDAIANRISLDSYMHNFFTMIFIMGVLFEIPLLTWLLSRIGAVTPALLRKYRRHAIVILLILAAVITPTGDPFTLMVVFLPLYLLFELGILLSLAGERAHNRHSNEQE